MFLFSAIAGNAVAQPLDDVSLEYQSDGIVATIHTTAPVQYLRHFPAKNGKTLEIFIDRAQDVRPQADKETSNEVWLDNETRNSPPSGLIPSFTVTTRDMNSAPKLVVEFSREAEFTVAPGKDSRSLRITIKPDRNISASKVALPFLPTIKPEVAPAATLTADEANLVENNKQARALMVQGREALAAEKNEAAIDALNKLLLLPPNDYTQDGQEWVGVARERAGQFDKAKTEYDLYLRLYTEGEGVARVMQRLVALSGKGGAQVAATTEEKKKDGRWMRFGSISSHYYYGKSNSDSTQIYNNVASTVSTSMTDTSMLITNVDASERYVSDEYDGRIVFRDANTANFVSGQSSANRLTAAYGEIKNRKLDYLLRVGRQSSSGGGVMGRFDGIYGSMADTPDSRVNGVVGKLWDNSSGSRPTFFGVSYDMGSYTFYGINQSVDGTLDRRALGAEWRYFEDKKTLFASVDYDTYFRALNAAQLMGTTGVSGVNVNFMLDHRKAPFLSVRNALNGASTSSISTLMQSMSVSQLRDLALARTATSNMAQLGATWPFHDKWQVGGDVRVSNTTGLPASGTNTNTGILAASPSRGVEKGASAQLVGSGIYKEGDIWSINTSITTSSEVNGQSLSLSNHFPFNNGWATDTMLSFYRQTDQTGGVTSRISPTLRGTYRIRDQLTFEGDIGVDSGTFEGSQSSTKSSRFFFSSGLRWDF
ncbi:MAG: hypothetical protein PHQ60_01375 [Sideroxydans sp.]|nr:hypothetical protein [Sideroxydans sp.]